MNAAAAAQRLATLLGDERVAPAALSAVRSAAEAWSRAAWDEAIATGPLPIGAGAASRAERLLARPVFVCGTHRSGTTLLRNLLDDHPQLLVLPSEGLRPAALAQALRRRDDAQALAWYGQEWLRRLANPVNLPPYWVLDARAGQPPGEFAAPFVRALLAWWPWCRQRYSGRHPLWPTLAVVLSYGSCLDGGAGSMPWSRWVEKTPTNEADAARLLHWFPQARVLQVIRAPAAVLESRRALVSELQQTIPWRAVRDLRRSYLIAARAARAGPRNGHRVVRHERLVSAPGQTMRALADFMGIPYHASLLHASVNGLAAPANSSFATTGRRGDVVAPSGPAPDERRLPGWRGTLAAAWLAGSARQAGYGTSMRRRRWRMKWSPN
jgi:hypothetical protein